MTLSLCSWLRNGWARPRPKPAARSGAAGANLGAKRVRARRAKAAGDHRSGRAAASSLPLRPRKYGFRLPRKAGRLALKSALSSKVAGGELMVVEGLHFEEPKTKAMLAVLGKLSLDRKTLIVLAEAEENVEKSARNLPGVTTLLPKELNVYDILNHDRLLLAREAVGKVEEALA